MTMSILKFSCSLVFCLSLFTAACTKPCARFKFPTLQENTLVAEESTTLEVPFKLDGSGCPKGQIQNFAIVITREGTSTDDLHICNILHIDGVCQNSSASIGCSCSAEPYAYHFTRRAERMDSTMWRWWTGNGIAVEHVVFDIHYPPEIRNLTLKEESSRNPRYVRQYSDVEIVCSFLNGNPRREIRLLDRHGEKFSVATVDKQNVRHFLRSVTCENAGPIRCEAPRARHNKTATLLVRCEPDFVSGTTHKTFRLLQGHNDAALRFKVRTHTNVITGCTLTKLESLPHNRNDSDIHTTRSDCLGMSTLTGTPPDLVLTVQLKQVSKADEGRWQIRLKNEVDTGHTEFWLLLTDKNDEQWTNRSNDGFGTDDAPDSSNDDLTESGEDSNFTITIAGACGSGGFIIIAIIIVIVVVCKIRGRRGRDEEDEDTPAYADPAAEAMGLRELDIRRRTEPSVEMHDYCDIPELNRASGAQAPYPENEYLEPGPLHLPPPPESLRPDSNPGGYEATSSYAMLNPVYETMRSAYADLRRLSQRLSRRLSRLPPPMFDDDD